MGRYFVAIAPTGLQDNPELKQLIGKMKRTLASRESVARWVAPDLWHVTLQFLGNMADAEFARLELAFDSWKPNFPDLHLRLQGVGAFPTAAQARALWVGVHSTQAFLDMQSHLAAHFSAAGFTGDGREFRPHLTLARLRNPQSVTDLVSLGGRKSFGEYAADEAILFESVLQGQMPKYIPLARRPLRA